ncbi:origin recognition complex subunit 1 [Perkinsela sp. CCAP 1560/4]|nr:origin recognition complex subunit 1 [Perkinsela sp. CCAP 1560/4]|eukprot:KNH08756.1 origin recognition complex subunit 1 [Perkinsela sp. CCAP 1560/4]
MLSGFVESCHELKRTEFFLLSGTPGVGKTFLAKQIMAFLEEERIAVPVYINCFEMDSPSSVHAAVLEAICQAYNTSVHQFTEKADLLVGSQTPSSSNKSKLSAQLLLEHLCKNGWKGLKNKGDNRIILLILDEIDTLIENKGLQPLATIFSLLDLLRYSAANLCIIGISNQVGIPALQEQKLLSRMNGQLIFKSYSESELMDILVRRMELYNGIIIPHRRHTSKGQELEQTQKLDIFSHTALTLVYRRCGGILGDVRQFIHGCEHVLIAFLGQSKEKWQEAVKRVNESTIFTTGKYNRENGLIETSFTFAALENFKSAISHTELRNLPFLGYVVLAICLRIQTLRGDAYVSHRSPTNKSYDAASAEITLDTLAEALHAISTRIRNSARQLSSNQPPEITPDETVLTHEMAERIENYAGLQWIIQVLHQLRLLDFESNCADCFARGTVRLNIEAKLLERALKNSQYSPWTKLISLI